MTASAIERTKHPAPATVLLNPAIQPRQHRPRFVLGQHHRQSIQMTRRLAGFHVVFASMDYGRITPLLDQEHQQVRRPGHA